jgi:putative flavoprotein involved in K+ transport
MTSQFDASNEKLDAIVVGAGQAGLGVGYYLKRDGRRFVVLERGRVGETWRSQRWDSRLR